MMIEEWEQEFFAWKEEIEGKYNKLSQAFCGLKEKLNEITHLLNHVSLFYESKGDYAGSVGLIK